MHLVLFLLWWQAAGSPCADVAECRRLATEAASRGDAEAFHDFAWRAIQKSKPNNPELMLLLARAQSLSGRPGDALVMLSRIVDLGVAPDIATDPDFARVRALAGWPELEAKLAGKPAPSASSAPSVPAPSAPSAPAASAPPAPSAPSALVDGLTFSAPGVNPFALAHDAVSRRFVLGDRQAHRLLIVDEVSRNVVNYVGAASAGLLDQLTGFTIDARRGDLWVVSAQGEHATAVSALHKLQLVSGRPLFDARPPEDAGPVRFVGVTVVADGTVYALDAEGSRVFRLRPGSRALEPVMRVEAPGAAAITSADDRTLYIAAEAGLVRVDVAAKSAARVQGAADLSGFESLAWRGGNLIGVERSEGRYLVVQIKLDAGGLRTQRRHVLAESATSAVGTVAGDSFYYLAGDTIRRVSLR